MSEKSRYHKRTMLKTITWRIVATSTTMTIVFLFTGELTLSVGVGVVEVVSKMIFYYIHEHIWNKISYGKSEHPLNKLLLSVRRDITEDDKKVIEEKLKELGYI